MKERNKYNHRKKILFAVYDRFSHDQRALETIQALSLIGKVYVVSYDSANGDVENVKYIISGNGKRKYLSFKRKLISTYKKVKPDLVFLHDNYTAFFINWLRKRNENVIIGYDSSELYYDKFNYDINSIKRAKLNYEERKYLNQADFVFAANIERAKIMKDLFKLVKLPTVWDNVHRIDDNINLNECGRKFSELFDCENIIFYCGGMREDRGTFELISAVESLGNKYKLIIAGVTDKKNLERYKGLLRASKLKNFTYVGYLTRAELKYILQKSKISVSIFDFSCVNNIFCASGKVYESIFEGTPILTSTNPPLLRLCSENRIGVSTDDYKSGILEIMNNYEEYAKNAVEFSKTMDYDDRVKNLSIIIARNISTPEIRNSK